MTERQAEQYAEIRKVLWEAYQHYFNSEGGDCYKSSEGYVEIYYPNIFDEMSGSLFNEATGLGIYSYALGPSRMHYFDSFEEALETVKKWHAQEMAVGV